MRGVFVGGMSAGPRLAVWLVLTALWVAVSLFLLREQAPASGSTPVPAAGGGVPASPAPAATAGPAAAEGAAPGSSRSAAPGV